MFRLFEQIKEVLMSYDSLNDSDKILESKNYKIIKDIYLFFESGEGTTRPIVKLFMIYSTGLSPSSIEKLLFIQRKRKEQGKKW